MLDQPADRTGDQRLIAAIDASADPWPGPLYLRTHSSACYAGDLSGLGVASRGRCRSLQSPPTADRATTLVERKLIGRRRLTRPFGTLARECDKEVKQLGGRPLTCGNRRSSERVPPCSGQLGEPVG